MTSETVNTDFLPIIYDIIRSIEKDTYENAQKPHETVDSNLKIPELRNKLQQCREQIQKLPGIDYTKEEQLRRLDALREQLVQKRQLLLKLNESFFKILRGFHIHDRHLEYFRNIKDYKNSLIQLNNDCTEAKLVTHGVSFLAKEKNVNKDEFFSHLLLRENVMKLSMPQLKDTMYLMANSRIDSETYEAQLKHIDEKCAMSVDRWPLDVSLYVLDAWFHILGPKIFRKHYYCAFTNLLNKKLKKCSKHNLILVLHFIGLSKKSPPFLMEFLQHKIEKFAPHFSDEEWAIVCLSFFKTSTKMESRLVLQHCSKAAENLMLKNDRFNLISILKCFRLSGYLDNDLISTLIDYIKREYTTFNFVECTNFLATFTTQNMYNFELFKLLENQGISMLLKEEPVMEFNKSVEKLHPSERSRVKDVARFLWGLSFVGHDINQSSINTVVDILSTRLSLGEFESQLPILIDCLQSLILCGHYPLNMIEYVLKPNSLQKISSNNKTKPKYQLYFIDRSAYIENCVTEIKNERFLNNIPKNLEKEVCERKGFQELIEYLDTHLKENTFTCCYIMPHIMIAGIIVTTNFGIDSSNSIPSTLLKLIESGIISESIRDILRKDKVYTCIEILDPSVCALENVVPLGLMKTKIRQLQKLNINVITLTSEEIFALTKSREKGCSKLQNLIT